jgi:hypothetical protein
VSDNAAAAAVICAFLGVVAVVCWITQSAWPLVLLVVFVLA